MRSRRLLRLGVIICASAACGQEEQPVHSEVEAPEWGTDVLWAVSSVDAPQHPMYLSRVYAGVLTDSSVIIADGGSLQLLRFDHAGAFLQSMGRRGDGPGEFRNIRWIAADGDGRVIVLDASLRRVSVFSVGGELHETFKLPDEMAGSPEWIARLGTRFVVAGTSGLDPRTFDGVAQDSIALFSIDKNDDVPGQAQMGQQFLRLPNKWWRRKDGPGGFGLESIHDGQDALVASDGGSVWATGGHDGRLWRIGERGEMNRVALPDWGEDTEATVRVSDGSPPSPRFQQLVASGEGMLLLSEELVTSAMRRWWVIDTLGKPVGRLRLASDLRILDVSGSRILSTRQDSMGVMRIEVAHMRPLP